MIKYSYIVLCSLFFITVACSDLDRTNPLDPKNPNSKRTETVLIESFVNQSGGEVITSSIEAFERLLTEYGKESFIYLEHHIEKTSGTDPWALDASLSRYLLLVPQTDEQAIPDVMFNGSQARVQGASDTEAAYQRYKIALEAELTRETTFTVEQQAAISGNQIDVSTDIAKLGNTNSSDIVVIMAVIETVNTGIRQIVRSWESVKSIGDLVHGEIVSVDRSIDIQNDWDTDNLKCVVLVQDAQSLQVFQCNSVDLK